MNTDATNTHHILMISRTCTDMNAAPQPYSCPHFCQGIYQRTRCYHTPLSPTSHPRAIKDTEILAPKWLPIWNGGVASLVQPGQALRVSSVCTTKPGVRVHLTS